MLIKAHRLVQLRKPFEKGGEEVNSMLNVMGSSGLSDGVHR